MKKIFTFVLVICITLGSVAQTKFQKTAGTTSNDRNYHIASMADGTLYATGYTESVPGNGSDAFLVKYNRFGEVVWAKTYGDTGDEANWDIIVTQNNQLVGVGNNSGLMANEVGVITRADTSGAIIWTVGVGSATGSVNFYRVIETTDGHLVVTGLASVGGQDAVLMCKLTSSGNLIWSRVVKTPQSDEMMGLIETSQGHYLFCGLTNDATGIGGSDFAVVKTDTAGNVIWKKRYGGSGSDRLNTVVEHNNSYYFLGWSPTGGIGNNDAILMKTDTAGTVDWVYGYGNLQADRFFNMLFVSETSSLICAGYTDYSDSVTNNRNTVLMSVDLNGNLNWARSYGSTGTDGHWPTGLARNDDEGYYVLSSTNTFGPGNYSLYLTKTDSQGHTACNQKNPGFIKQAVTGWSGVNFGTDSTITLASMPVVVTGMPWNIATSAQCCELFVYAGTDIDVCDGSVAPIGDNGLPGYQYNWYYQGGPAGTGPSWQVPSSNAGTWTIVAMAPGSACTTVSDSVIVTMIPSPPKPTISYLTTPGNYLVSSSATDNQWYRNGIIIVGANQQQYHAVISGVYHVEVTNSNGCKSASDTLHHTAVGISEQKGNGTVTIHPNPASSNAMITFGELSLNITVRVYDLNGRVLSELTIPEAKAGDVEILDTGGMTGGIYSVVINGESDIIRIPLVILR